MQLVATLNNVFFRAISTSEKTIESDKETMLQNQVGLVFQTMTDLEFEQWLTTQ